MRPSFFRRASDAAAVDAVIDSARGLVPPIDAEIPARLASATFAAG